LQAFIAIVGGAFGHDSLLVKELQNWLDWLIENKVTLCKKQQLIDKTLPAKIEFFISETCNLFISEAKYGIPSIQTLLGDDARRSFLQGSMNVSIPQALLDILTPPKKRDATKISGGGSGGGGNNGKRGKLSADPNKKQYHDLKMSEAQYKNVINPALRDRAISNPKCNGDLEECLKFQFVGMCHSECNRKDAHNRPAENSDRLKNLRKFKKTAFDKYGSNFE
jgi:hypothetical protein